MYQTLSFTCDAKGIATLTLARPDKHNAMSGEMLEEIADAASLLKGRSDVRVVVLAAEGRSFCAGGDLAWMRAQFEADDETRRRESAKVAGALLALDHLPQPLIGKVQGNAFGGGLGLMAVCDAVVAVETAVFGFTETRLGVIPANIGPFVVRRMGPGPARRVLMSARTFDAVEAQSLGLVSRVVARDALEAAVEGEAEPYLSCAPGAVAETKALLRDLGYGVDQAQVDLAIEALAHRWRTQEAQDGIAAFFAKTPPPWKQT
ncbi:crotonase/enoyl-CoA hydratase family protein [Primorskyibacter sp. S187A]|uniref:crotonase/enoyl-CoA hydratase family protein n=1 Tax=Primorskyibacter sp. S187A TaxID=3415130 RepID=UPI003C7DA26C